RDLFYRLNVVPMELAPLRQRTDDIADLCRHFLHQIAKRENKPYRHIESEAVRILQRYQWPGNIRELQNIIERASVLESDPGVIRGSTIEPWLRHEGPGGLLNSAVAGLAGKPLADLERQVILSTSQQLRGHRRQ